jgi:LacI family transcriptional regulator, gluconate utilization system Gnt-I transcriptional repressor
MEDVARHAGVSLMTVSRALRKPDSVAAPTRARIEQAMADLSYVSSAIAGQLATGRTRLIAVVLPNLRNPVFALALQGISDAIGDEYELVVAASHGGPEGGGPEGEASVIRTLLSYRPAGIVIHSTQHTPETRCLLAEAHIPVVEVGSPVDAPPIDLIVGYSHRAAGRAATEHLIARSRQRIGFVSQVRKSNDRAQERWQGYREALASAGIPARPWLEIETTLGCNEGRQALEDLLQREPELDAVFFLSDMLALGALFHCQRTGIRVPDRLAIVGFDDQEFAAQTIPALTTIRVPRYEIGLEAGRLLRLKLSGAPVPQTQLDLGFRLIERESS